MNRSEDGMHSKPRDPQEIDLFDLLGQLWRGKGIITLCIVISMIVAGGYLLVAKQRWISIATVTLPDSAQITPYQNAVSALYNMTPQGALELEARAINRFANAFGALAQTLDNQDQPEKLTIEPLVKNQAYPLKLTYQAQTALEAQSQLTANIDKVNKGVARELTKDLTTSIAQQIDSLKLTIANQEQIAQEQKDLRISQIREALKFAEAASLQQPQVRQADSVSQDTLFLLGSEALGEMITRESSRPLVFSQDYYQIRQQLLSLEGVQVDPELIQTFRYVLPPTLPHVKEGPKKALIMVLAIILGGMAGCGLVLGRNAYLVWQRQKP